MRTIGAYEAKTHLPRLLDEVAKGESITITKHGVPVAVLNPPPSTRTPDPAKVIAELQQFRQGITLGGLTLRELIDEGRR
jgi:prevent-host-death family protein